MKYKHPYQHLRRQLTDRLKTLHLIQRTIQKTRTYNQDLVNQYTSNVETSMIFLDKTQFKSTWYLKQTDSFQTTVFGINTAISTLQKEINTLNQKLKTLVILKHSTPAYRRRIQQKFLKKN